MAERSVVARLRLEVSAWKQGAAEAKAAIGDITTNVRALGTQGGKSFGDVLGWVNKNEQSLSKLTTTVGFVGAGLTAAAAIGVKKFADFDQAMSAVAATGDEARASITALRDAAIDAGAKTIYNATESANAITEMAKAGVAVKDILGGGLTGALNLASAGTLGIADAASIASTTMNQFKLQGKDVAHIADVLAATAGKANGEVSDVGVAMKYVGPVAAQMGVSLEEAAGTIALLAQNGVLADSAGTGLRGMLMSLTSPTEVAQRTLTAFGISAFDTSGKFVGLTNLVGQLHDKLGPLDEATRSAALGQIFGNNQITTARILYSQGADAIAQWTAAVDDQGYASEVAATKLDNLKGDIEKLSGSFDTVLIQSGSGANDVLRAIVQTAETLVDAIGKIPTPVLGAITILAGAGGLVMLGVAGFGKLVIATASFQRALVETGTVSEATATKIVSIGAKGAKALGKVLGVLTLIAAAASAAPDGINQGTEEMAANVDKLAAGGKAVDTIFSGIGEGNWFTGARRDFKDLVEQASDTSVWAKLDANLGRVSNGLASMVGLDIRQSFTKQKDALKAYGTQLGLAASQDLPTAARAFRELYNEAGANEQAGNNLLRLMPDLRDALIGIANDAGYSTDDATLLKLALGDLVPAASQATTGIGDLNAAQEENAQLTEAASKALDDWRTAVSEADQSFIDLGGLYDGLVQKQKDSAQAAADATKSSSDSWNNFYDGQTVSAAQFIAALQAQVTAQQNWESNIFDIQTRVTSTMTGSMKTAGDQMVDELMQLGPEGAAAVQLIHDMSDEQFAQVVALYGEKGAAAVAEFTNGIESARAPQITPQANLTPSNQQVMDYINTVNAEKRFVFQMYARANLSDLNGKASGNGRMGSYAQGAIVDYFANGAENHVAQIAPAGAMRMWAEPETGGEAYIPLAASKRARSLAIYAQVGKRLGVGNADGALYAGARYAMPLPAPVAGSSSAAVIGGPSFTVGQIVAADPKEALREFRAEFDYASAGVPKR